MCTTATRARVRLPWSQTAVPPKGTNCSHCSITWWFEWWERGRGIVGTDKQPLGLQTLFDSEHGEWDLTIAGKYCPRTPEPPPQPTVPSRLLLHEFICAHWFLRGSLLTKFDWLSLRANCESPKRHLGPGHCLLLGQQIRAFVHPAAAQNITQPSSTSRLCSLFAVADPCPPAAFRLRNQQQQSFNVGARDAQERSRRARSLFIQAALCAPSTAERDIILEALGEFPDPRDNARSLACRQLPNTSCRQRSPTGLPPPAP